jgi:hypothetical protein
MSCRPLLDIYGWICLILKNNTMLYKLMFVCFSFSRFYRVWDSGIQLNRFCLFTGDLIETSAVNHLVVIVQW